jgi:elongation factor Ts
MSLDANGQTVEELLTELTATIGEKITLRRVSARNISGKNAGAYTHSNKRVAATVIAEGVDAEVLRDIAMHAAAMNPEYIKPEDVPAE